MIINGFDPTYEKWVLHGEHSGSFAQADVNETLDLHMLYRDTYMHDTDLPEDTFERGDENFKEKIKEAETPLYPGCTTYTKMSAIVALYKHKTINGLSDKGFNELLEIIKDMLPESNILPVYLYTIKKNS